MYLAQSDGNLLVQRMEKVIGVKGGTQAFAIGPAFDGLILV
jgi:hypothetical protein